MTIYDQDYIAELNAQEAAMKTGVQDPAAEDQEASTSQGVEDHNAQDHEMVDTQSVDESADASNPIEIPSDKEMNFKALREELAAIKQEKERLAREFEGIKRAQNVQRQPEPPRKRAIDEISNEDLVTGAQFKQIMAEREAEYQLMVGELQVKAKYSDYDEVTAKYGVPLIEQEPDLAQGFLGAQNKASYLYKIGKQAQEAAEYRRMLQEQSSQQPVAQSPQQPSQRAQKIMENSRKPGTLSSAVGGSGTLSKADYWATCSEAEFQKQVAANLGESTYGY
jgi:hypothetical protein